MALFGDLTGKQKEENQAQLSAEQKNRENSLTMISPGDDQTIIDEPITIESNEEIAQRKSLEDQKIREDAGIVFVDESQAKKKFRVIADLDDVTIGAGNNFTFKRGQVYEADWDIYWHLKSAGLTWEY